VARAEKLAADHRAALAADIVRVYVDGAMDRVLGATREVVAALAGRGDGVDDLVAGSQRLAVSPGVDTIAARRRIADAVIAAERLPF